MIAKGKKKFSNILSVSVNFRFGFLLLVQKNYISNSCDFQANDAGDYFPIWGTCMGMQLLTVLVAGENLLTKTPAENLALPLNLTTGSCLVAVFM